MNNYIPTIGIEVHLELTSNTKVFSGAINNYHGVANTQVSNVDLGYPGALPIINAEVIKTALKAALALNMKINKEMHFDRKNYFYPDLPKGYQITQMETPIGYDGYLMVDGKKYEIERIHIEEDTCKSLHESGRTLLNYNRSGVPLVEIVSKPVFHSSLEAMRYLETLKELMFYLGVSDCKMEEGSMRADINVSISKDDTLGTRTETKNVSSIRDVGLVIEYEINRQKEILDSNGIITEETRKFDKETSTTILMRKKETGNDYRYIPEPDIPYLYLDEEEINEVKKSLVLLPNERREIYKTNNILDINIEKIIANKPISDYLNMFINDNIDLKIASNLLLGDISAYLNKADISIFDTKLTKEKFINLVDMLQNNKLTSKIVKDILVDILENDLTIEEILKEKNIVLIDDSKELDKVIAKVLEDYKQSVIDYKNGKDNALKFLMGMVMKESKGSFNPAKANESLIKALREIKID